MVPSSPWPLGGRPDGGHRLGVEADVNELGQEAVGTEHTERSVAGAGEVHGGPDDLLQGAGELSGACHARRRFHEAGHVRRIESSLGHGGRLPGGTFVHAFGPSGRCCPASALR